MDHPVILAIAQFSLPIAVLMAIIAMFNIYQVFTSNIFSSYWPKSARTAIETGLLAIFFFGFYFTVGN